MAGEMLSITPRQQDGLAAQVEARLEQRIGAFLWAQGGPRVAGMDGAALAGFVRQAMAGARANGVTGERGLARWAYLRLLFGDGFERSPTVAPLFPAGADNDRNLHALFDELARREAPAA